MPYLIDGHNLIAHLPGLRLSDADDEARLAERLRLFCQRTRSRAVVYFDRGHPAGEQPAPRAGLTVHFVRAPRTADHAIRAHLTRLGREARNWTVVTSDGELRSAARQSGARTLTSPEFARRLQARPELPEKPESPADEDEVTYWEARFRRHKPDA
ncbi:MAG: NYN domain-containing protein [Chloroflexota bacterium]